MTAYVERAAFLRDVQPGDRIRLLHQERFWTVTGRMDDETFPLFGGAAKPIVSLTGMHDDASPVTQMGAPWVHVIVQVPVPESAAEGGPS